MELLRGAHGVVRVGHRGAAALAPENSLAAIEAAADCGADAVELDVLQGLIVAHGPEVPAGAPRLDEALALVASLGLAVQLDVKVRHVESGIVEGLRRHGLIERSFVSSFSLPILLAFATAEPQSHFALFCLAVCRAGCAPPARASRPSTGPSSRPRRSRCATTGASRSTCGR
jgi:hypothetical protein